MKNMWKSAIMGVVVGDALGTPVQFESRAQVAANPVHGMIGYRTFNMPAGTWTDDSSLTLATMEVILRTGELNPVDVADNFEKWLIDGEFTPYGFAFDVGRSTRSAIVKYKNTRDVEKCGCRTDRDNGNGSLMRIMPAVLYCTENNQPVDHDVQVIHDISALTHAHIRSKIACGLYYFMAHAIARLRDNGYSLIQALQVGIGNGFLFYENRSFDGMELGHFARLRNLSDFKTATANDIKSSGYVVDTLEAAIWGLITTNSYREAMLKVVNLGEDTDTIAAVAGGLAGLYYGYDAIPAEWLKVIQRRDWIEDMCNVMDDDRTE